MGTYIACCYNVVERRTTRDWSEVILGVGSPENPGPTVECVALFGGLKRFFRHSDWFRAPRAWDYRLVFGKFLKERHTYVFVLGASA